jgi:hypothetical protein
MQRTMLRQSVWPRLLAALPGAVTGLVALAAIGAVFVVFPIDINADLRDAPPRQATAVVNGVLYPLVSRGELDPPRAVSLHWGAVSVTARTYVPVQAGQRVKVAYRIGRSGRVYVDEVEALPEE